MTARPAAGRRSGSTAISAHGKTAGRTRPTPIPTHRRANAVAVEQETVEEVCSRHRKGLSVRAEPDDGKAGHRVRRHAGGPCAANGRRWPRGPVFGLVGRACARSGCRSISKSVVRLGSVQVFTFWDGGRYYQYTVEVSVDGKTWTQVVDMSRNKKPATAAGERYAIPPTAATIRPRQHVAKQRQLGRSPGGNPRLSGQNSLKGLHSETRQERAEDGAAGQTRAPLILRQTHV